jgi:hypothetical protein
MSGEMSRGELDQRVAVVKRFKELLARQRERFGSYLHVLEKQEGAIEGGNGEEILAHVELERQIVADIFSIQNVINPLEDMYRAVVTHEAPSDTDEEIPALRASLEGMKAMVQAQSAKNRELLSSRMAQVRTELDTIKNNPFARNSRNTLYDGTAAKPLIDIKG